MAYLKNGGTLEKSAAVANHASTRPRIFVVDDERSSQRAVDEMVHWLDIERLTTKKRPHPITGGTR